MDIHQQALEEFDAIQAAVGPEREQCVADRRFVNIPGAQWEGQLGQQFENRPKLEFNKVLRKQMAVVNENRMNEITVVFRPKDGAEDDALADACASVFRADEQDCNAADAYDNAFEEAVGGGFGAVRLSTEYCDPEDDDSEEQRICIDPIYDADISVFFSLDSKRPDKSDASSVFVLSSIPRAQYIEQYDDDPASWPQMGRQSQFEWQTPDVVYIAEWWKVETAKRLVSKYQTVLGDIEKHIDLTPEERKALTDVGSVLISEKKVKTRAIHKYTLSGGGILEDGGIIAGRELPIVPMYGRRFFIDGIERQAGVARAARDAQVLGNMMKSRLAEIAAYATIDKPIFTPEQMTGHENMWASDGEKNWPYLLVNPVRNIDGSESPIGPVGMTKAPDIPVALAQLVQMTEADMQDINGEANAGQQATTNTPGIAMEMAQNQIDMQSYIYLSNRSKMVRRVGQVWLSMASDVYAETGRKLKAIGKAGTVSQVEIGKPILAPDGSVKPQVDFSRAKMDVVADVGPASSSKRAAVVRSLTGVLQVTQDPEAVTILTSELINNMEGEGFGPIREFYRKKLLGLGIGEPTEKDKQEAANAPAPQPDANAVLLMQTANKAKHDAELADAKTGLTRAQTVETLAGIEMDREAQAIQLAQLMQPQGTDNAGQ